VNCIFLNIENIISLGWRCNLHSCYNDKNVLVECEVSEIIAKKPFITKNDKGSFNVKFKLDGPTSLNSFIILRSGDVTVGMGKIIN